MKSLIDDKVNRPENAYSGIYKTGRSKVQKQQTFGLQNINQI